MIKSGNADGGWEAAGARAGGGPVGPGAASQTLPKLCQIFQPGKEEASLQVEEKFYFRTE
jgi:hypothetical protein